VPKEDSRERAPGPRLQYVLGQRAAGLLEQRNERLAAALCPADAKLAPWVDGYTVRMAARETATSVFTPDLSELRALLEKMIAALGFVEMVTAILALIGQMRDINTELTKQLTHLRSKRPRSETLKRLERQLTLPLVSIVAIGPARPSGDNAQPKDKKRRGRHPGRGALPAHLARVPIANPVPPELRICPRCGSEMTTVGQSTCKILNVIPARIVVE